jgi:hypothetical protein
LRSDVALYLVATGEALLQTDAHLHHLHLLLLPPAELQLLTAWLLASSSLCVHVLDHHQHLRLCLAANELCRQIKARQHVGNKVAVEADHLNR